MLLYDWTQFSNHRTRSRNAIQNLSDLILLSLTFEWYSNLQSTFINNSSCYLNKSVGWILLFFLFFFTDKVAESQATLPVYGKAEIPGLLFWEKGAGDLLTLPTVWNAMHWLLQRTQPWLLNFCRRAYRGKEKFCGKKWNELGSKC